MGLSFFKKRKLGIATKHQKQKVISVVEKISFNEGRG